MPTPSLEGGAVEGWALGFIIGAAVVVVVVALLLTLIVVARRIAADAEEALDALRAMHDHTSGLWELRDATIATDRLTSQVAAARGATGKGSR
jgi:hypothetical protein